MLKHTSAVLMIGLLAACTDASVYDVPQYTSVRPFEVVLAPGQAVIVDRVQSIEFERVSGDSRCAIDVVCFWQGNAEVEVRMRTGTGPTHPFTLNTGVEPHQIEHAGYRVRLVELSPQPVSTASIEPGRYRARLRVEAVR